MAGAAFFTTPATDADGVDTVAAAGATASRSMTSRSTTLWSSMPKSAITPIATHAPTPPPTSATTHGRRAPPPWQSGLRPGVAAAAHLARMTPQPVARGERSPE